MTMYYKKKMFPLFLKLYRCPYSAQMDSSPLYFCHAVPEYIPPLCCIKQLSPTFIPTHTEAPGALSMHLVAESQTFPREYVEERKKERWMIRRWYKGNRRWKERQIDEPRT